MRSLSMFPRNGLPIPLNRLQALNRDGAKQEVSLVFLGETGSGKTTLLKALNDAILNTPFEKHKFTPKNLAPGRSQTKECNQYTISNDIWSVRVIDTPGLADTDGIDVDEKHLKNIFDFLIAQGEFNAICFVLKRGTNRETLQIKHVINELKSMLPKDSQNNFIVCLTFSDLPIPDEDTLAVIKSLGLPEDNIISIDNKAYEKMDYDVKTTKGKMVDRMLKTSYANNMENLMVLLDEAKKFKPYKSQGIKDLKFKRDKLKEDIALLAHQIDDSTGAQTQMQQIINQIQLNKGRNIQTSTKIRRRVAYKENGKITTHCKVCSRGCHPSCHLSYGDDLDNCAAMSGNNCKQCGCPVIYHTHLGWGFKDEYEDVLPEDPDSSSKPLHLFNRHQIMEDQITALQRRIQDEEKKKEELQKQIQKHYNDISQIALIGHNYVYEDYLKVQLKQLENSGHDPEFIERKKSTINAALKLWNVFKSAIKFILPSSSSSKPKLTFSLGRNFR